MDSYGNDETRRKPNTLPIHGNAVTMNLNTLILTNITNSPYFKTTLAELTTYHEVVDEIYYKVKHLEPWEKGSRRTAGQTGMCGGVRGVGAGGIISTAFCLLYKLFTMKLTRKQVVGLMNHGDSPYIRGIGFMYVRFTQPPGDLWDWFESYIDDAEELEVRAGGGQIVTIGEMVRLFLTRLDWFSSLFPRIPVPIQIAIDKKLAALKHATSIDATPKKTEDGVQQELPASTTQPVKLRSDPSGARPSSSMSRREIPPQRRSRSRSRSPDRRDRKKERYNNDHDRYRGNSEDFTLESIVNVHRENHQDAEADIVGLEAPSPAPVFPDTLQEEASVDVAMEVYNEPSTDLYQVIDSADFDFGQLTLRDLTGQEFIFFSQDGQEPFFLDTNTIMEARLMTGIDCNGVWLLEPPNNDEICVEESVVTEASEELPQVHVDQDPEDMVEIGPNSPETEEERQMVQTDQPPEVEMEMKEENFIGPNETKTEMPVPVPQPPKMPPWSKKPRRPLLDIEMIITNTKFKRQLKDASDTTRKLNLAPRTKRAFHLSQTFQGPGSYFAYPGRTLHNQSLLKLFYTRIPDEHHKSQTKYAQTRPAPATAPKAPLRPLAEDLSTLESVAVENVPALKQYGSFNSLDNAIKGTILSFDSLIKYSSNTGLKRWSAPL